jgi:hypothetical protein
MLTTTKTILSLNGTEYILQVEGDYEPFVPAKLSGPPEDCYPAEGGTFSITAIKHNNVDLVLPQVILNHLEEQIAEEMMGEEGDE